jgi:hypothetical protein
MNNPQTTIETALQGILSRNSMRAPAHFCTVTAPPRRL